MNQITPNHDQFLMPDRLLELEGRRKRKRRLPLLGLLKRNLWFILVVIVPTLLSGIYLFGFAADQYLSEASFVIQAPDDKAKSSSLASMLQSSGTSKSDEQTAAVMEYIQSRDALTALQQRLDIASIYDNPSADLLSRYSRPFREDSFETLYDYYQNKVEAYTTNSTGISHIEVKAFTPGDAQKLASEILNLSEELVNRLNQRAHDNAIADARKRVAEAEDRVRQAQLAMTTFRNSQNLLDPTKQSSGTLDLIGNLEGQRAATQAQLDQTIKATPNNPGIKVLRERIDSLQKEIDSQTARLVGNDAAMASKISDYENLSMEKEFAEKMLATVSASLETARAEADRQQFYLERVVEPNRPDLARYPERIKTVLVVFGATLCFYFVAWMLITGIVEHAPKD